MKRKVLITGLGAVTPIGNTVQDYWQSLVKGIGGIGYITRFDAVNLPVKIAGEVKSFDPLNFIDKKLVRRMDRFTHFSVAASQMAIADSGINFNAIDHNRAGVIVGSGIGGIETLMEEHKTMIERGPGRISPFFIVKMISDIAPGYISIFYGLKGPNYAVTSACASASHAIGCAFKAIQYGDADVMVCGGSEASITELSIGGFANMKALSVRNDDPHTASRPFDLHRDGFVMGEGAGIVLLEAEEIAVKRGAKIYGELAGVGFTGDAYHVTEPAPEGEGAIHSMCVALEDAGMTPDEIEYINAHGTSTPYNDKTETLAIKTVFGEYAYRLPISSTKSMTGHLLGAAGGIELIAAVLAMKNDCIPPTINYQTKDPDCDLDYVPNTARYKPVHSVLSNTFGFGGHNATLVAREYRV
jgi:3-oxoacyl-[acyl-carrier-protein] synthase II